MVWAALEVARKMGPGHRIVTVAPDGGGRDLSTALFSGTEAPNADAIP